MVRPLDRSIRIAYGTLLAAVSIGTASARPYHPPPPLEAGLGLSCETQQPGLPGPHPFTCPTPAPQPIGSHCLCQEPQERLGIWQPGVAGRVVP